MRRVTLLAALLLALLAQRPASAQVPVHLEPRHRNVLENHAVRVLDVLIPPGDTTLLHRHEHNTATVLVSGARTWNEQQDGRSSGGPAGRPGTVAGNVTYAERPSAHRVANRDTVPFRIIVIELLAAPGVARADPSAAGLELALENVHVRAYRVTLPAGESTPPHVHAGPGLFVHVTPAQLIEVIDGAESTARAAAGEVRWRDGGVRHQLRNTGRARVELIELELR